MTMSKRLLVLAAGILQLPIIKRAKEMGCYVIAADGDPNAMGFAYADKAICANIVSEDDMLKIAIDEKVDDAAIAAAVKEAGYEVVG